MKKKKAPKTRSKRKLTGKDLYRLRLPVSAVISPCEKCIAYTVERMNEKEKKYFSNIHVYNRDDKKSVQFTHGDHQDRSPVWSPDGSQLAFISTRDKKTGIYIIPTAGGAEKQIIEIEGAIANLQWTPDARQLVFALRYNDSHHIKDEKEKKEPPVFRHITRLYYRLDGSGFLPKDRFQIYALTIADGKLRQITDGSRDNICPHLSPDGKWITYVSNRRANEALDMEYMDLFVISFKGGKEKKIPTPDGPVFEPKFSPNGKLIAYLGNDDPEGIANTHIWLVGVNNTPKAKDLTPNYDRCAYDQTLGDMSEGEGAPLAWSRDGKRIYFLSSDTGATNLFYVPRGGGNPTRVFRGKCHIKSFSVNGSTRTAALIYSDLNVPGEVMT
ncbi:MAG: TolB family protein, partial [Candidatus Zixiibacteriota bacterium]